MLHVYTPATTRGKRMPLKRERKEELITRRVKCGEERGGGTRTAESREEMWKEEKKKMGGKERRVYVKKGERQVERRAPPSSSWRSSSARSRFSSRMTYARIDELIAAETWRSFLH